MIYSEKSSWSSVFDFNLTNHNCQTDGELCLLCKNTDAYHLTKFKTSKLL